MEWEIKQGRYTEQESNDYRDTIDTDYHRDRVRMAEALLGSDLSNKEIMDFGCGDGLVASKVVFSGAKLTAIDADPSMVDACRKKLSNARDFKVLVGDQRTLSSFVDSSFDGIIALNVLAYLTEIECSYFYRQARRILKPNGALIVSHSNELFDMFTLNKYTVKFYMNNFSGDWGNVDVSALLRYPDRPERKTFATRENPLAYACKMKAYGFIEEYQEYAIFHTSPPLLNPEFDPDDLRSRPIIQTQGWPAEERWKLLFACSIFGSRLRASE